MKYLISIFILLFIISCGNISHTVSGEAKVTVEIDVYATCGKINDSKLMNECIIELVDATKLLAEIEYNKRTGDCKKLLNIE